MTTILQPATATRSTRPARRSAGAPALALDTALGRLERTAAHLPHALAVPVMVAHAALSTVAYR